MAKSDEENVVVKPQYTNDQGKDHNDGVFQRFRSESHGNIFSLQESNGRYVDVTNSFAPESPRFHHVLLLRVGLLVWSIVSLALSIISIDQENRSLYLAYLTRQGLVISICYQIAACIVTIHRKSLSQPNRDSQYEPSVLVKVMWFLYFLATPLEIIITILYWVLEYPTKDISPSYVTIFVHGILAILLLIDGNLIARIPLRIKQVLGMLIYAVLYLIWTVIHGVIGIGNGSEDGDLLYDVIDWKEKPLATAITSIIIVVVVVPIVFIFIWMLSLVSKCSSFNGGRRQLHDYNC